MHVINEEAYKLKEIKYDRGLFDDIIDCTYVIHLEGNGRLDNIYKQLNKYKPTKKNFILFNKGYKKSKKNINIDKAWKDLVEANFYIFLDAKKNNYENILVLEDDFYFDDSILKKNTIENITNFIKKKKDQEFLYSLGCFPSISIPLYYDRYSYYTPLFGGMHSCIFSKKYRENILKHDLNTIFNKNIGWDLGINPSGYIYHKPLCYQLVEETENKQEWEKSLVNKIFFSNFIRIFNMDKDAKKGFFVINTISHILFYVILFIIIIVFYIMFKK